MAKPIKSIVPNPKAEIDERNEDLDIILQQIASQRETISDALIILEELHESGVIDIVKSLLSARSEVGSIAMEQINQPDVLNILRNSMSGLGLLASIDSKELNRLSEGIVSGLQYASERKSQHEIGIFGALKAAQSPNIKTTINTMLHFLEGMGEHLNQKRT